MPRLSSASPRCLLLLRCKPMSSGWIKLHRKLLDKGYYKNSQYVHLWVHLLLLANHKEHEFMHDGKIFLIKEGQLLTGRKQLVNATGIPATTIERILNMLESEHQIGQQKTSKYRIITILNWKDHQERTPERTSGGHLADTYKNEKNEKKNTYSLPIEEHQEVEEGARPKRDKVATPTVQEVLDIWNAYPNWRATGKSALPRNPSAIQNLLSPAKLTSDLKASIIRKRSKYSLEEIETAIKAYATEIANRSKDSKGFYLHRFTAYEFFTYKTTFERYVTR